MRNALRATAVASALVAAAFGYVHLAEENGRVFSPGTVAPGFRLPSLMGPPVDIASYRGRVVVLNFWATWCPPCVREMPSLERLHRTLGPEGLAVVTVSADEDAGELRAFVARHSLTLPILLDPGGRVAARAYHTVGYPETFVLDRSGKLLHRIVGPAEWDTPEALAHFRSLLASSGTLTGWRKDPIARVGNSSLGSGVKRPVSPVPRGLDAPARGGGQLRVSLLFSVH